MLRFVRWWSTIVALAWLVGSAHAQSNLQAEYVQGQVFLRWDLSTAPAVLTYDIYASPQPENDIALMTLVGRVFPSEAIGDRLHKIVPNATLRLPSAMGPAIQLTPEQGAFVWTPHQAGSLFFAVVAHGNSAVTQDNRAVVTFAYDPANDPVQPHWQLAGVTEGGYPYDAFVVWADGRDDPSDARPDFPVMGNARRGGVPHVFVVTRPLAPLPATPYPCVFALHGGGGHYHNFLPGVAVHANLSLELTNGIVVTPEDNIYFQRGPLRDARVTQWFGYARQFDPFTTATRVDVPPTDVIIDYTSRRFFWILDWLTGPRSPYRIDPDRVSVIGHSAGSRGASHLSRHAPHRFAGVVLQSALIKYTPSDGADPVLGQFDDNIRTNILSPETGQPLTMRQVIQQYTRISDTHRDFAVTRTYSGKHDESDQGGWSVEGRAELDAMNASRMGLAVSWDDREHDVDRWSEEADDAFDSPAHCDPWPDLGQWIAPVKTRRHSAQYLADTYRVRRSYPGFFNADLAPSLPGRQPDPGTGDPCTGGGAPWGTWGGFFDWDTSSIIDTSSHWECRMFLVNNSGVSIDDCPVAVALTDVAPRKTLAFRPASGTTVYWRLASPLGSVEGHTTAETDGLAVVSALAIPRAPAAARLTLSTLPICVADLDDGSATGTPDGGVTIDDLLYYISIYAEGVIRADLDDGSATGTLDGGVTIDDLLYFLTRFDVGC